jgi:DNA-binding CsgD family transcriptional regulator
MTTTTMKRQPTQRGGRSNGTGATVNLGAIEKTLGMSLSVARQRYARLTERERQVAGMMSTGKPNREIAEELGISPKTLDIHRANLMHKLEARTTASVANTVNLVLFGDHAST